MYKYKHVSAANMTKIYTVYVRTSTVGSAVLPQWHIYLGTESSTQEARVTAKVVQEYNGWCNN